MDQYVISDEPLEIPSITDFPLGMSDVPQTCFNPRK